MIDSKTSPLGNREPRETCPSEKSTTSAPVESILEARDVGRKSIQSDQWLIRDVNLSVRLGEGLAIVGSSGSGKTVLLRALCLLDPIDEGQVLWGGAAVPHATLTRCRGNAIYLAQQPSLWEGTVEDNLRRPLALKVHRHKQFDRKRIVELLELLGRDPSFLIKRHSDLSGGERQIACLLRAIQLDPKLLLLDEPTAALDSSATSSVETLIAGWLNELPGRRATVWVTHDVAQARRVADVVMRMHQGHLERDQ